MSKIVAVYCVLNDRKSVEDYTKAIANQLQDAGVHNVRALQKRCEIRTDHVKILVRNDDPVFLRGLLVDECFYFPKEIAIKIRKSHQEEGYDGELLDYILEEEEPDYEH